MDSNETTAGLIEEMKTLKYEKDLISRILEQTNLQLRHICTKLKSMKEELKEERIKRKRVEEENKRMREEEVKRAIEQTWSTL